MANSKHKLDVIQNLNKEVEDEKKIEIGKWVNGLTNSGSGKLMSIF